MPSFRPGQSVNPETVHSISRRERERLHTGCEHHQVTRASAPFRALIVDDEMIVQQMLRFTFDRAGFICDVAGNGLEAKRRLSRYSYDVVVTDLIMPESNGGDLVVHLCAHLRRPIIVVHTAVRESEVAQGLRSEGVDEIVYKPASYGRMADQIRRRVEARRMRRGWKRGGRKAIPATRPQRLFQSLKSGNQWIERSVCRSELFRFLIAILASILFGLGSGNSLTTHLASVCQMFGLCGVCFYVSLELVAHYRKQTRTAILRYIAEQRLLRAATSSDGEF